MPKKNKEIELRSEEVQEILTSTPNWMIRWGNVLFLFVTLILLFISWLVKYPDIITSEALITTQIPPQKETAKTTGNLSVILVKDKEKVKSNQALAIIENTASHEDVFKLKSITDTIKINKRAFSFPLESLPALFLGEIEPHFASFENSYINYQINKQLKPFSNITAANRRSILELSNQLDNLKSQKEINKAELEIMQNDLIRHKTLFEKGIISAKDYEDKQLEVSQAERNYRNFESSISQRLQSISNARNIARGTEINQVREDTILLKYTLQSFNQLKKAIRDWEYKYVLRSNIDGEVSFLSHWNNNQIVNRGDMVFIITPDKNTSMIAKLKTPVQNSGKIKIGQQVHIKLKEYPYTEFGVLKGVVKTISAVPNNDGYYFIDVELPLQLVSSYKKTIEFKYEMQGFAEIITEDLRLIERIFYQFKEVINR